MYPPLLGPDSVQPYGLLHRTGMGLRGLSSCAYCWQVSACAQRGTPPCRMPVCHNTQPRMVALLQHWNLSMSMQLLQAECCMQMMDKIVPKHCTNPQDCNICPSFAIHLKLLHVVHKSGAAKACKLRDSPKDCFALDATAMQSIGKVIHVKLKLRSPCN